jgi:hypothetical protein
LAHEVDLVECRVPIGYKFMRIVTKSKPCRIYNVVLETVKVATRNSSGAINLNSIIQQILDI